MAKYFVETFFLKRKKIRTAITTSIIVLVAMFCITLTSKISNLLILNSAVKEVIKNFTANEDNKVELKIEKSFLRSELKIKDMYVSVNTGTLDIAEMVIKKKSGFLIPSVISINPRGILSSPNNGKKYDIVSKNGHFEFLVKLNRFLTQKPTFGGVKIEKPIELLLFEKNNNIGNFNIDVLDFLVSDTGIYTNYKGSMVFRDGDFIPSVIVLDKPFKWDVKMFETKTIRKSKLYGRDNESVNNLTIEKMDLDFDFSKVSLSGKSIYGNQLYTTDIKATITNDGKFIDAIFNMIMQTREGDTKMLKKMHKTIKEEIIPIIRKNSSSTKKELKLYCKKTENDSDVLVNDVITMTDIVNKLAGI